MVIKGINYELNVTSANEKNGISEKRKLFDNHLREKELIDLSISLY